MMSKPLTQQERERGEPPCDGRVGEIGMRGRVAGERRERERDADAEVAERREALEVGIEREHRERHRAHLRNHGPSAAHAAT